MNRNENDYYKQHVINIQNKKKLENYFKEIQKNHLKFRKRIQKGHSKRGVQKGGFKKRIQKRGFENKIRNMNSNEKCLL